MCGIIGIYEKGKDNSSLMRKMLDIIEHRGPDDSSVFVSKNFTFGHRRLSIIDLVTGGQPIFNEDKSLAIIFNGEIYNYPDLRKQLLSKGHKFYTNSDTEVILHGYEEFGTELFGKLNGIFAFAILKINEDKLILVRDQFGIKPLHYYFRNNLFIFSSEQKAILLHESVERKTNFSSLHLQLNLRYNQSDETLFENIKRLPPASFLIFDGNQIKIEKYWSLQPKTNVNISEEDAIEGIQFYIKQAVRRQLISDVPIGVYLSGGMDSSTIVQMMNEIGVEEINTFTLGFNEPSDEFPDAARIANLFETNHRSFSLEFEPLKLLPKVIWHAEEPKINLLQGFNMSKFVHPHVKVILGGLGGDELFAGYDIHKFIYPISRVSKHFPDIFRKIGALKSNLIFKLHHLSNTISLDEYRRGLQLLTSIGDIEKYYLILRNVWDYDQDFYKDIYSKNFLQTAFNLSPSKIHFDSLFTSSRNTDALEEVLFAEFHSKMVNDYLLVEDRMSMANSVEERVPFLDLDLVEFAFLIPAKMKIKNGETKYLFRKAMKGKLPDEILRKKKWGFTVNPYLQFKKDLKSVAEKILTKEYIEQQGIFNYNYIHKILNHRPNPRLRWHYNYLWVVLGFAIWEKMFITSNKYQNSEFDLEDFY